MNRPAIWTAAVCVVLLASVLSPLDAPRPAGASASAEPDAVLGDARDLAPAGAGSPRSDRTQTPDGNDQGGEEQSSNGQADAGRALSAPVLGEGFALRGEWLAPGLAGLDWDDAADVSGYELLVSDGGEWLRRRCDDHAGGFRHLGSGPSGGVGR